MSLADYTDEELRDELMLRTHARLLELLAREPRLTYGEIATKLGEKKGCVVQRVIALQRRGLTPPRNGSGRLPPMTATAKRLRTVQRLRAQGKTWKEAGAKVGWTAPCASSMTRYHSEWLATQ